jgi:hypothetical protein
VAGLLPFRKHGGSEPHGMELLHVFPSLSRTLPRRTHNTGSSKTPIEGYASKGAFRAAITKRGNDTVG